MGKVDQSLSLNKLKQAHMIINYLLITRYAMMPG